MNRTLEAGAAPSATPPAPRLSRYLWPPLLLAGLGIDLLAWQPPRELAAATVVLAYLGFCGLIWHRHRQGRPTLDEAALPVVYASQGGQARALAERSAAQLQAAGLEARALPLEALDVARLERLPRLLLVASTYGEGEAPDHAAAFERALLRQQPDLSGLDYALLALGDSHYRQFCGFARRLDGHLRQLGARPLHDRLEADRLDPATLRQWQEQLGGLAGNHAFSDWQMPDYRPWRLCARTLLNPGSQGQPVFHLRLVPEGPHDDWQAGDIAEVGPCHPAEAVHALLQALSLDAATLLDDGHSLFWHLSRRQLPAPTAAPHGLTPQQLADTLPRLAHREYSIASVAADGSLELVVRQMHHPDGRPGLGSGWLCRHAALNEAIDLRVRANPNFRLPSVCGPLVLIGNGTGIAGLRAHLHERQRLGQHGHWLLFGERQAAHDRLFDEELKAWLDNGHLARLDRVYSRDQAERLYVQHRLREQATQLRDWLARGAVLLVCGSLEGMGREVDALLRGLLGPAEVDRLSAEGRYRRDLY